jgi:putative alpha-1,2-mannosidase
MEDLKKLHYQVQIHLLQVYPRISSHNKEEMKIRINKLLTKQVQLFLSMDKTIQVNESIQTKFFRRCSQTFRVQTLVKTWARNPISTLMQLSYKWQELNNQMKIPLEARTATNPICKHSLRHHLKEKSSFLVKILQASNPIEMVKMLRLMPNIFNLLNMVLIILKAADSIEMVNMYRERPSTNHSIPNLQMLI